MLARGLGAAAAAACAATAGGVLADCEPGGVLADCAPAPPAKPPHRVLVVGAGLTGSLTASLLRRRWPTDSPPLDLHVWERASYPAGRFGAAARYEGAVADMGAQVLSVVDPNDDRAQEGQGVANHVAIAAFADVKWLEEEDLLSEAPLAALSPTEERLGFEGLWRHYWAPLGLTSVLERLLTVAAPTTLFGTRCDSVRATQHGGKPRFEVHASGRDASGRWPPQDQGEGPPVSEGVSAFFDAVVVCAPAPQALLIDGVEDVLHDNAVKVLKGVRYDARTVHALFLNQALSEKAGALFREEDSSCSAATSGAPAEINLDGAWDERPGSGIGVHFMALQGAKRGGGEATATIVAHCEARSPTQSGAPAAPSQRRQDSVEAVYEALALELGLTVADVRTSVRHVKTVDWTVAQTFKPAEALFSTTPSPPQSCLESGGPGPKLVVAGDFMTHASYIGCYASADAAVNAVLGNSPAGLVDPGPYLGAMT